MILAMDSSSHFQANVMSHGRRSEVISKFNQQTQGEWANQNERIQHLSENGRVLADKVMHTYSTILEASSAAQTKLEQVETQIAELISEHQSTWQILDALAGKAEDPASPRRSSPRQKCLRQNLRIPLPLRRPFTVGVFQGRIELVARCVSRAPGNAATRSTSRI